MINKSSCTLLLCPALSYGERNEKMFLNFSPRSGAKGPTQKRMLTTDAVALSAHVCERRVRVGDNAIGRASDKPIPEGPTFGDTYLLLRQPNSQKYRHRVE